VDIPEAVVLPLSQSCLTRMIISDPKNGILGTAVTSPQPKKQTDIYFTLNRGNRIVVDLRVPYKLTKTYVFDQSYVADSIWIYTGKMNAWKLQTTIVTKGDPTGWGWRRVALQDSSQFLMIRFNMPTANINEVVLYGCPTAPIPPLPPVNYDGPRLPRKTMRQFLGVNIYNSLPIEWLQPFSQVRMYTIANTFDMDTTYAILITGSAFQDMGTCTRAMNSAIFLMTYWQMENKCGIA
jgi:hypothetical protein